MDGDKKSLRIQLATNPEADPDREKAMRAWRSRRRFRLILAVIAAIAILAQIALEYYIGLHK